MIQTGKDLVFLKLGGSLITDKLSPRTARNDLIQRIAEEIAESLQENPHLQLILGHGSGSFGHTSGKKYRTREGVSTPEEWRGFAEVWQDAASLNFLVMKQLKAAGLPAIAFPPSSAVFAKDGKIATWDLTFLRTALEQGLLPVIYGDVVFDSVRGGTIVSTEDLFVHLAKALHPGRILLAGRDPGVWEDFPQCTTLLEEITPGDLPVLQARLGQSGAPDVTGGMQDKVKQMLDLVSLLPGLNALIFSGEDPGSIHQVLIGHSQGTWLHK